uniref:Uncharacterized protein n=1 Tax=Monopterus albus TaxID=43700 RepID=A0A3Q3IHW4_MONAL
MLCLLSCLVVLFVFSVSFTFSFFVFFSFFSSSWSFSFSFFLLCSTSEKQHVSDKSLIQANTHTCAEFEISEGPKVTYLTFAFFFFLVILLCIFSLHLSVILHITFHLRLFTVLFCRQCSFKKEQTSALLSIIKSIHELCSERGQLGSAAPLSLPSGCKYGRHIHQ